VKVAYADPPYLGCGSLYKAHHADSMIWNDPEAHRALIVRLQDEFPDGWAMSCSSPSLRTILPMTPADCRVSAWVKPFAVFKPNVGVAYAWEPVIWRGGRRRSREQDTVRDWHAANITLERGLTGAKPASFCVWIFQILNLESADEIVDLFPGTGTVSRTWQSFAEIEQPFQEGLFA
jgi:hypothetical protein